jgi:E3 ubiquitin-protein ligase RBBP6
MSGPLGILHYKFKNEKKWHQITFEAGSISVIDVKRSIVSQKKIAKSNDDFDLRLTNVQTGDDYMQDGFLIPKNTSLTVRRVPALRAQTMKLYETE